MDFKLIGLGVVVIILIYVLYTYYTSKSTTLLKTVSLSARNTGIAIVDFPQSYRYTYNVWIYVNTWNWNDGTMPIFYREVQTPASAYVGSGMDTTHTANKVLTTTAAATAAATAGTGAQFALFLAKDRPTLYCQIPIATPGDAPFQITSNFPIQTWTYISISVDSQYVDFYVNGKLVKSVQLSKIPSQPADKDNLLYLGTTGDITISGLERISAPSAPQDVWSAYINGNPAGTSSSSYNINMDLVKNQKVQSTYNVF